MASTLPRYRVTEDNEPTAPNRLTVVESSRADPDDERAARPGTGPRPAGAPRQCSWLAAPAAVGLLVLVYHGWALDSPGAWRDEGATMSAVDRSWSSLFSMFAGLDAVHALYYVLMKCWSLVFGFGVVQFRVVSLLATTATAMILVQVGRRLSGTWFGVCAALAFAMVPRAGWAALEARSPALATFMLLLTVILLMRALERDRKRDWLWFGLGVAGALAIFLYNAFGLIALVVCMIGASGRHWIRAAIAGSTAVLICLPLGLLANAQAGQVAWMAGAKSRTLVERLPPLFTMNSWDDSFPWLLIFFAAVGGTVLLSGRLPLRIPRLFAFGLVLAMATLSWLVPVLMALLGQNMYADRYAAPATPGLALMVAALLAALRPRWVGCLLLGVLMLTAMPGWLHARAEDGKEGSRQLAEYVAAEKLPGDGVLFARRRSEEAWVESHGQPGHINSLETAKVAAFAYPAQFDGLLDLTEERPARETRGLFEERGALFDHQDRLEKVDRVWVVRFNVFDKDRLTADRDALGRAGFSAVAEEEEFKPYYVQLWVR